MLKQLNESDLEERFVQSSGPGGQNVNKIASKVLLRHVPTNVTVTVQESRYQAVNREIARERMLQLLQAREREAVLAKKQEREKRRRQNSPRPRALKRRILESKRQRSSVKAGRAKVRDE